MGSALDWSCHMQNPPKRGLFIFWTRHQKRPRIVRVDYHRNICGSKTKINKDQQISFSNFSIFWGVLGAISVRFPKMLQPYWWLIPWNMPPGCTWTRLDSCWFGWKNQWYDQVASRWDDLGPCEQGASTPTIPNLPSISCGQRDHQASLCIVNLDPPFFSPQTCPHPKSGGFGRSTADLSIKHVTFMAYFQYFSTSWVWSKKHRKHMKSLNRSTYSPRFACGGRPHRRLFWFGTVDKGGVEHMTTVLVSWRGKLDRRGQEAMARQGMVHRNSRAVSPNPWKTPLFTLCSSIFPCWPTQTYIQKIIQTHCFFYSVFTMFPVQKTP